MHVGVRYERVGPCDWHPGNCCTEYENERERDSEQEQEQEREQERDYLR